MNTEALHLRKCHKLFFQVTSPALCVCFIAVKVLCEIDSLLLIRTTTSIHNGSDDFNRLDKV